MTDKHEWPEDMLARFQRVIGCKSCGGHGWILAGTPDSPEQDMCEHCLGTGHKPGPIFENLSDGFNALTPDHVREIVARKMPGWQLVKGKKLGNMEFFRILVDVIDRDPNGLLVDAVAQVLTQHKITIVAGLTPPQEE